MTGLAATALQRSPAVLARQVKPDDPNLVLLHPQTGEYYTLDPVGSRVWQLCDGKNTVAKIATIISQEFDAPAKVIERDVLDLLTELLDEKLVLRVP